MSKSWFTAAKAAKDDAEIAIYDDIGMFGITAKDFRDGLKALGPVSHINVRINSDGGIVADGFAIYNMLKRHRAHVTVTVDGVAASMASIIAMAGDVILMPQNTWLMIHDPTGIIAGSSDELRTFATIMDKQREMLVDAYADRTGMARDEISQMMADETWLTAEEAVAKGFADAIEKPIKMAAHANLSKFRNAPALVAGKLTKEPPMAKTDPVIFETLTLDQLKAERPDIAEAYQAEVKAQMEAAADAERIAAEEAAAAANAGKETPEQIEARIRADAVTKANARAVEVATMCSKNGMTAKLAEYIGSDKDVGEIAKSILNERVAGGAGDTNNRHNGGHGNPAAVVDTNEVWSKWNAPKH